MRKIALLTLVLPVLACGEPGSLSTADQSHPKEIQKTLVFEDGTTTQLKLTPGSAEASSWHVWVQTDPVGFDMNGIQNGNRFEFKHSGCSEHSRLTVNLADNTATFSYGLFSVDAKVTDSSQPNLHPATGEWEHFTNGVTFPEKVTTYSVTSTFRLAVHSDLLWFSVWSNDLRVQPNRYVVEAIGLPIECTFWGRLLRSGEFEIYLDIFDLAPQTGAFAEGFTAVTFHHPQPITQTSRKVGP